MACLALSSLAGIVVAQNVQIRDDRPDSYIVVRGDTLWDISGVFLENPAAWPQIWRVNPQIDNPDLIYPGDIISLRYIDGRPVLELQRGAGVGDAVIRLSPGIRFEPLTNGIGEISFEDIASRLSRNLIVDPQVAEDAGYMLGTRSGNLFGSNGEVVYARGDWDPAMSSYAVVRPRRSFVHPDTGDVIGIELDHIGEGRVLELNGEDDLATIRLSYVVQEVRRNDRVIQQDRPPIQSRYIPVVPDFAVNEYILGFTHGTEYGGAGDSVIVSGGQDIGLEVGHLLTIRRSDQELADDVRGDSVTVRGESYASAMVYRVFENASFALVLNSSSQMKSGDKVGND